MTAVKKKIGIIGSCVTRDAVKYMRDVDVNYYIARSSLASIYARPWGGEIPEEDLEIPGKGAFENRMLRYDLYKESSGIIRSGGGQSEFPIIVDFIDERFDLLSVGGTIVTQSNLFEMSAFGKSQTGAVRIRRDTPQAMQMWKDSAMRFLQDLEGRLLVLHRAVWAESYRNNDTGEIIKFSEADLRMVGIQNRLLNEYYDFIAENYGNIRVLSPRAELIFSDFAHRWGRDFFHFGSEYYLDFAQRLSDMICQGGPAGEAMAPV